MKINLMSLAFKTKDTEHNKKIIIKSMREYAHKVDLLVFGESFLHGFEALSWNYENDKAIGISLDGDIIKEIKMAAMENSIAVSFGMIEKMDDALYSSQITVDKAGEVIDVFRRVSDGWKEPIADAHYKEGDGFHTFDFEGKKILVGICGDFWHEGLIEKAAAIEKDLVLWPVYTDFEPRVWNEEEKFEYAKEAAKLKSPVLYVNSVCYDFDDPYISKGGACHFDGGKIIKELPSGAEAVLAVEIN
ncbi:carbon-nitrogen hydrolase family protein [uncultured Fenollaria sp.]|uniref:carbon-nitrogen hydrolase family protein n=1 Tax=uncultured Fenollaria sp. TaxID=1686315 RepID=UPI0025E14B66|nr:carbon-nitrogen hydrolase family protein [uncultured Fenollaria sp.]